MADNPKRRRHASTSSRSSAPFGSRTDIGCVRDHNEDSLIVAPPLFAVADGMGGHAAGEVASEIAVNTLAAHAPDHIDAEALGNAVIRANQEVIAAARDGRGRDGMGTTMTVAMIEGERLIIAQVGDSRAYLLHRGNLQQLTRDHSLVSDMVEAGQLTEEEARVHPQRSVITRALGSDPDMLADLYEINVESGDRLLICSDGLSTMLVDTEIEERMRTVPDPQRCANTLVSDALKAGGHDNVTVIVADVTGFSAIKEKKAARKIRASVIVVLLLFAMIIGGAVLGFNYYTEHSVYLTDVNGKVAIYRGIPGSVFGFEASELDQITDINVADLKPSVATRLEEGIVVDNMEEAEKRIEDYRKEAQKSSMPGANSEGEGESVETPDTSGTEG